MADTLTAIERSERMARVRSNQNHSTELRLIEYMRAHRIRGWRRAIPLPGKPDFVFAKEKVLVFVDGCFWHGCPRHRRIPKSRVPFWKAKLKQNIKRDRLVSRTLRAAGWTVLRVWECSLTRSKAERTLKRINKVLNTSRSTLKSRSVR